MGYTLTCTAIAAVAFLLAVRSTFSKAIRAIHGHPGFRVLLNNYSILYFLLQRPISGVTVGSFWPWLKKHESFKEYGLDIISVVSALPYPEVIIWVADASAAKEFLTNRFRFPKPIPHYKFLAVFGGNIISSEGDEWKRHHKVCAPSFNEPNSKLVWGETVEVMTDLFHEIWGESQEVAVDDAVELTHSIAMYVIGRAGFGQRIGWSDTEKIPSGYRMTFKQSLRTAADFLFSRTILPVWIYKHASLKHVQKMRTGFEEFETYMKNIINARQTSESQPHDLLSNLLQASDDEADVRAKISENELLGNMFLFLYAGHESTAHTMAFALGLLAVYQDEQELLYQELKSVAIDGQLLVYQDAEKLRRCAAVINETMRMYPSATMIPKVATEDTTLTTSTNTFGDTQAASVLVPIPKGSYVALNIPALHYNPRYWDDPFEFKPSRFLGDWNHDAFLPFGTGPRSCLGRRFAELELMAAIATTILRYKVQLAEDQLRHKETLTERKERVLKCKFGLNLTPVRIPLVFRGR